MDLLDSLLGVRGREVDRNERLVSRPGDVNSLVLKELEPFIPTTKKPNYGKFPDKISAVESTIPVDHPFAGKIASITDKVSNALADPDLAVFDPKRVVGAVITGELARPDYKGNIPLEQAYRYKRAADSSWFGLAGESKSIKKLPRLS